MPCGCLLCIYIYGLLTRGPAWHRSRTQQGDGAVPGGGAGWYWSPYERLQPLSIRPGSWEISTAAGSC